jgi:hypothetical protein
MSLKSWEKPEVLNNEWEIHPHNSISNSDCISGLMTNVETNVSQDKGDLKQLHTFHTFCIGKFKCNYKQRTIFEIKNITYAMKIKCYSYTNSYLKTNAIF